MLSKKPLLVGLMMLATASTVSGCGDKEPIRAALPPAPDLVVEPKPAITPDALTSDIAAAQYDSELEAWGERGWAAVGRICRWAREHGSTVRCPD